MSALKTLFYCEIGKCRSLWCYFLFLVFFVTFFINENDSVIAIGLQMSLLVIFIIWRFKNDTLLQDIGIFYGRNQAVFILFGFWAISSFISLAASLYFFDLQPVFLLILSFVIWLLPASSFPSNTNLGEAR